MYSLKPKIFKRVPEGCLQSEQAQEKFRRLTEEVSLATNSDDISRFYVDFCVVLDSELLFHGSSDKARHRHQPWWSSDLV